MVKLEYGKNGTVIAYKNGKKVGSVSTMGNSVGKKSSGSGSKKASSKKKTTKK